MTTGLFSNRPNIGAPRRIGCARKMAARLSTFADLLADEFEPEKAAEQMGFSGSYGRIMLAKIRAQLGWQSV